MGLYPINFKVFFIISKETCSHYQSLLPPPAPTTFHFPEMESASSMDVPVSYILCVTSFTWGNALRLL